MAERKSIPATPVRRLPAEVIIAEEQKPVPVVVEKGDALVPIQTSSGELSLPPTTTLQADIVTAGQRKINLIWEDTQRWIALSVVIGGVLVNSLIVLVIILLNAEVSVTQLSLISICLQFINLTAGIVIGFYFSRTNHSAQGGTGEKPPLPPYTGR